MKLNKKITIVFLIDKIASKTAGTEKQLLALIAEIDKRRFNVILCCLYESACLHNGFDQCKIVQLGLTSWKHISSLRILIKLYKMLKVEHVDIVQLYLRDAIIFGPVVSKFAGVPLVISSRRNKGHWLSGLEMAAIRFSNFFVDRFLANSAAIMAFSVEVEKISKESIDVIYNGFDFGKFSTLSNIEKTVVSREYFGIAGDDIVAVVVGNLRIVKGHAYLIDALPAVLRQYPNFKMLIVGDGSQRKVLDEKLAALQLEDNVIMTGARSDVLEILSFADMGISSSLSESLSNAIIEYMAVGLPVLATEVGGTSELIGEENGLLVEPGDSRALTDGIVELLADKDNMIRLGINSRRKAKKIFDLQICMKKHEKYYEKYLAKKC